MQIRNPFHRNRAEQMGESIWKYYVESAPFVNLLGDQPLIFEGSRGSGKTMFFLCNSWREKFSEYIEKKKDYLEFLAKGGIVGFYYKVDGKFVGKNLSGKGVSDHIWKGVFNTYFNVIVTKDILHYLKRCIQQGIIANSDIQFIKNRVIEKLKLSTSTSYNISIDDILLLFDKTLDGIEAYSNDPDEDKPILLNEGTLIKEIIEKLRELNTFNKTKFHVFVDEFEELSESQQQAINTLIKQSQYWLVFDIGVKTDGRLTSLTSSGSSDFLREPDDYKHWHPERDLFNKQPNEYIEFLRSICAKRLSEYVPSKGEINADYLSIDFYLKQYDKSYELSEFSKSSHYSHIKRKLTNLIYQAHQLDANFNLEEVTNQLVNTTPDILRMHLALLNRDDISVQSLYEDSRNNSKIYKDWKHNTLMAVHFLLCKELDVSKKYSGVETFALLSSGVIRSFLEICESAFEIALSEGFSFEDPRHLTLDEQTNAAHYVSQLKVGRIEGLVPDGVAIKRLILALGRIFYNRHTDPNTTLGEPEPNHFGTYPQELDSQSPEATRVLKHAVMHNVLQIYLPTKQKNLGNLEITDYHLNHIYCPYFKISHRRKRKIKINPLELKILITGNKQEVDKTIRKLSALRSDDMPNLFNYDFSGEI